MHPAEPEQPGKLPAPSSNKLDEIRPWHALQGYGAESKISTSSPPYLNQVQNPAANPFEGYDRGPAVASASQNASLHIADRSHDKLKGGMDPFEVRIRFTSQLQNLNASVTSATKAAQYALKYRDMDEDLHSCILEQLERVR